MNTLSYAYVHARPNTQDVRGVFYVGHGTARRVREVARNNLHHCNIVNKYGKENILVGKLECSTKRIAAELEVGLIKCLKRAGVKLTNRSDGGESGNAGARWSDELRIKMVDYHRLRCSDPDYRARMKSVTSAVWANSDLRQRHSAKLRASLSLKKVKPPKKRASFPEHFSPEIRAKFKIAQNNLETKTHLSSVRKNMVWINDGKVTTRVQSEDLESHLLEGWKRGRK